MEKGTVAVINEKLDQNAREHAHIGEQLTTICSKLDHAMENKADKTEVEKIDNRFWALLVMVIVQLVAIIVGYTKDKI